MKQFSYTVLKKCKIATFSVISHLSCHHLCPGRLHLHAAAVVPGGTWRRPAAEVCGPLLLVGKLEFPGRFNAVAPGFLVHEMNQFSGRRFLVDAGAISSSPSAVPGYFGQAASSTSAVPGSSGQAASSPSAGPGPLGQAATPTQEVSTRYLF